ncbi:MAG: hypothetical protein SVO01_06255 [Thermotogota bacterium]|nr:hypothetical protein [Thermotogota bacterium]
MRQKMVWRYYCDYCGKGGCGKWQMAKHEKHCTMNPNRVCRMCEGVPTPPEKLAEAIAILPDPTSYKRHSFDIDLSKAIKDTLPMVRGIVDDCPACILAALRQKGQGKLYDLNSFDYGEEVKQMWVDRNAENDNFWQP